MIPPATESELDSYQKQWEADGYTFLGNGSLDRDDPPECPGCGATGYFYALWEHPTRETLVTCDDGEVYLSAATNAMQRCYECGHVWVDVDEIQEMP